MKDNNLTILWLALIGAFLTVLDTGILYTGTVELAKELQLSASQLSWIQVAYVLTYAGFMLLGGKLGDIYGRKFFFIFSLVLFGFGSLFVGLSTNATMIIAFRAFQGIGAAILQPTCLALITDTFEGESLQKYIGYYAAVIGAGAAVGIAIGGFLATFLSWRVGFIVNMPLALIMSIIAFRNIKTTTKGASNLDLIGTVLSILSMVSLSYGISGKSYKLVVLIVSAIAWLLFIYSQKRVAQPTMPLVIFKDKQRLGAYIGSLLFSSAGVIFWFYIPQFMQKKLHYSAFISAIGMVPMAILLFVIALKAGKLVQKFGNSKILLSGLGLVLISAVGLAFFAQTMNFWIIFPFTLTFGAGFALTLTPLTGSAMVGISSDIRGAASGVYNTTRQFGAALGLAVALLVSQGIVEISIIFKNVMMLASVLVIVGILCIIALVVMSKGQNKE